MSEDNNINQLLDEYFTLQQTIYDHFGYIETWAVFPLWDSRDYLWWCDGHTVGFAKTSGDMRAKTRSYCEHCVLKLSPHAIYESDNLTMICVDTHADGNKFLQFFDNAKRREP